jgi:transposase
MARSKRTNHTTGQLCAPHTGQPSREAVEQEWLSRADIALRSTSASTAIERRRWQVIGLLADGAPLAEIVGATGYRPRTIRQIAQRYRERGSAGLADGWQRSAGAAPILSEEQQRELRQALQKPAPDDGVWTGPKVARWIAARTGKRVHRQRGWEYLRRLGGNPSK